MTRILRICTAVIAPLGFVAVVLMVTGTPLAGAPDGSQAATYQVDLMWPQPLPNHWILGSVTGVAVDASDRVWLVHRGRASMTARTEMGLGTDPQTAELCCAPAPQVLAFDREGGLVRQWGGPGTGYDWPQSPGALTVDAAGNVWIAAAGVDPPAARGGGRAGGQPAGGRAVAAAPAPPPQDAHVLKFSADGKFLMQIGRAGNLGTATSTDALNRPSAVAVDGNEVFVADTGSRRVVVFDATTGAHKRHWGAYGEAPDSAAALPPYDPAATPVRQFRSVSCVEIARDGTVYVCDRTSNRIQVFQKNGTFVREVVLARATGGNGAVWDVAFSSDAAQRSLLVADGQNQKVRVLTRSTLAESGSFGSGGRWPGTFYGVGSIAVDSRGVVYTGETFEGKRIQKFTAR